MSRRSDQVAEAILSPLTESQRERLVAAMTEVHRLLRAAGTRIERVDPAHPAARWCVAQYFAELARRFEEVRSGRASRPTTPSCGRRHGAPLWRAWTASPSPAGR
jgi:hypothetical protein